MHLVFQTPSRNCPLRRLNGRRVTDIKPIDHRYVRRIGACLPIYMFKLEGSDAWIGPALADELHVITNALIAHEQRGKVAA